MLKKIAFLTAKIGMSFHEFDTYWKSVHGSIVANSDGYREYRNKYVQNHIIDKIYYGDPFPYAGIAEFWIPTAISNEDDFSRTAIYQNRIRIDEEKFIEMENTIAMAALQMHDDGCSDPYKIIISSELINKKSNIDSVYSAITKYYDDVKSISLSLNRFIRGFSADFIIKDSFSLPGARAVPPLKVGCLETFRFADESSARSALMELINSADLSGIRRSAGLGRCQSFLAQEMVFFENGAPTKLATRQT